MAEPALAKAFAGSAARLVDWLRDEGVEFMSVGDIPYAINPVAHASNSRLSTEVKRSGPGGAYIAWLVADYVAARVAKGIPA